METWLRRDGDFVVNRPAEDIYSIPLVTEGSSVTTSVIDSTAESDKEVEVIRGSRHTTHTL